MSKRYIPIDLGFEHYSHVKHDLNAKEYAKILAEISKERYAPVNVSEAYDLYFKNELVLPDKVRVIWLHDIERPATTFLPAAWRKWNTSSAFTPPTTSVWYR